MGAPKGNNNNPKGNPATLTAPRFGHDQSGIKKGNVAQLRQALNQQFARAMLSDFEKHGVRAIVRCREKSPEAYVRAVAGMMPKEFQITSPLDELNDDQLTAAIAALQSLVAVASTTVRAGDTAESAQTH